MFKSRCPPVCPVCGEGLQDCGYPKENEAVILLFESRTESESGLRGWNFTSQGLLYESKVPFPVQQTERRSLPPCGALNSSHKQSGCIELNIAAAPAKPIGCSRRSLVRPKFTGIPSTADSSVCGQA